MADETPKVLHGALAIIKSNGVVIGKMRNIRATENMRRIDVRGLGTILNSESPVVEWSGTLSCSFFEITFKTQGVPGAIRRDVQSPQEFEDNILLDHSGIQLDIFKKVEDFIDPTTKLIKAKTEPYAVVTRLLIESEDFDISEGSVAGHNQSFRFLDPILYPTDGA